MRQAPIGGKSTSSSRPPTASPQVLFTGSSPQAKTTLPPAPQMFSGSPAVAPDVPVSLPKPSSFSAKLALEATFFRALTNAILQHFADSWRFRKLY